MDFATEAEGFAEGTSPLRQPQPLLALEGEEEFSTGRDRFDALFDGDEVFGLVMDSLTFKEDSFDAGHG